MARLARSLVAEKTPGRWPGTCRGGSTPGPLIDWAKAWETPVSSFTWNPRDPAGLGGGCSRLGEPSWLGRPGWRAERE